MNVPGFYLMRRGWRDNPIFKSEPYTEREAWEWIIEEAAFKPVKKPIGGTVVSIERGQIAHSIRFMAKAWNWSKSRVARYLSRLAEADMIVIQIVIKNRDNSGAATRTLGGTVVSLITLCNYDRYQRFDADSGTGSGTARETKSGRVRDKLERKKRKKEITRGASQELFDRFWDAYPSRHPHSNPKKPALSTFGAAINQGTDPEIIIRGARHFAAHIAAEDIDPRYVKQAANWLKDGLWVDHQESPRSSAGPTYTGAAI